MSHRQVTATVKVTVSTGRQHLSPPASSTAVSACSVSTKWLTTPTLSLRVPAQKRPRTHPKNPPRSSSTQRLFRRETLRACWRATRPPSRAADRTLSSCDSNSRRGSPRAGRLLYPTSPAAQECWDSTGQFLTRGFQESRPPPSPPPPPVTPARFRC